MTKQIIGIIGGNGKMGTYFTRFFNSLGYKVIISDKNTKLTNKDLAKKADVVIISVPIEKTIGVIKEIVPYIRKESLFMDFTSIKVSPVKEMLKSKASVIGCHPIFGPFSGMKNQIIALCAARPGKWLPWIKKIIKEGEGIPKILTPKEHDKLMAVVQVLTHFSDITLGYTLKKLGTPINKFLEFQSPPYRLKLDMMGRILDQDPGLYGNIMLSNPEREKVMKAYMDAEKELFEIAKKQDLKSFITYFKKAANYLGEFKHTAMRESNYLVGVLNNLLKIDKKKTKPKKTDLAVLGPANTYTDQAAIHYAPQGKRYYCQTITEVFQKVDKGEVSEGIIPIETKSMGSVTETMDELTDTNVFIKSAIILPIKFSLASIPGSSLKNIQIVLSKNKALAQCSHFLRDKLPKAVLMPETSTAEAMAKIVRENLTEAAAIGDKSAAKKLGLKILKDNIGNINDNQTKFIIITRKKPKILKTKGVLTLIAFSVKDKPGMLAAISNEFAKENINLTKIESRPSKKALGKYNFFLEFEGNYEDKKVKEVLKKMKKKTVMLKVLGSYKSKEILKQK